MKKVRRMGIATWVNSSLARDTGMVSVCGRMGPDTWGSGTMGSNMVMAKTDTLMVMYTSENLFKDSAMVTV